MSSSPLRPRRLPCANKYMMESCGKDGFPYLSGALSLAPCCPTLELISSDRDAGHLQKTQGTEARVHIGQVIMSRCRTRACDWGPIERQVQVSWLLKDPHLQEGGFTKFNMDKFESTAHPRWLRVKLILIVAPWMNGGPWTHESPGTVPLLTRAYQ